MSGCKWIRTEISRKFNTQSSHNIGKMVDNPQIRNTEMKYSNSAPKEEQPREL